MEELEEYVTLSPFEIKIPKLLKSSVKVIDVPAETRI